LVAARHRHGAAALLKEERDALDRLLADADLLGTASFLLPDRAQALADRARRMRARNEILKPSEFLQETSTSTTETWPKAHRAANHRHHHRSRFTSTTSRRESTTDGASMDSAFRTD
jgi:hypothetical protein